MKTESQAAPVNDDFVPYVKVTLQGHDIFFQK